MFIRVFVVMLGTILAASSYAAAGESDFKQGIKAFRAKQYDVAITFFERSQRKGNRSSALKYNLGVTYYKLARYPKAEQAFTSLLGNHNFRQLAHYNLGLVKLAQQRKQAAIASFSLSAEENTDPKITALANRMLHRLAPHLAKRSTSGLLSIAYGHDSNVTLAATESPTHQSDNYVELFGFLNIPAGPVLIRANLLEQDYRKVNDADFMQLSAGILYPLHADEWTVTPSLHLAKYELNGTAFQTNTDVRLEAKTPLSATTQLDLRYRYTDIRSDDAAYDFLAGSRQQFRVQRTSNIAIGQLRLRYELELNDRRNLPTANYSPTRHTLRARLRHAFVGNWQLKTELSWRDSRYGEAAGVTREDKRYQLSLDADIRFHKGWRGGLRYSYSDNQSNLASESYTRNDTQIYANWLF